MHVVFNQFVDGYASCSLVGLGCSMSWAEKMVNPLIFLWIAKLWVDAFIFLSLGLSGAVIYWEAIEPIDERSLNLASVS